MRKCPNCQINQLKTPRELATGSCRICQAKTDKAIMAWWEKKFFGRLA